MNNIFENIESKKRNELLTSENTLQIWVEKKGENGEKTSVARTLRNEVAVNQILNIAVFDAIENGCVKNKCIGMSRVEKKDAESVGLKSAKQLINKIFPKYSENTINKYRRIGKIFGKPFDKENPNSYEWREGIDFEVSVTNLDAVLTLVEGCENVDDMSEKELAKAYEVFYKKYIVTDRIHLLATLKTVRSEVDEIKHPSIIDGVSTEVENTDDTTNVENTDDTTNVENTDDTTNVESPIESALNCVATLSIIFKKDSKVKKALEVITEAIGKLQK